MLELFSVNKLCLYVNCVCKELLLIDMDGPDMDGRECNIVNI